ncbi:MAG: type II toxin-antitoxin system VapC family toxin [Pseudaminobacter sp.]
MFILDTNVISEMFSPRPSSNVMAWLDTHGREDYWITAISRAELQLGMLLLPDGRRRQALGDLIEGFFHLTIRNEVLPFGKDEADIFAEVVALRRRSGRPIGEFDAQIAAIARARNFAIVTRNVRDFEHCGIEVINPWDVVSP